MSVFVGDAELLPFQEEDVQKLKSKRARLIGNDPGTGKTYEGIALDLLNRTGDGNEKLDLQELFPSGVMKTLVLAPKSVLDVWDQHLMELTTEDIYVYSYSTRYKFLQQALDPNRGGYFIMNWDSIRVKDMVTHKYKGSDNKTKTWKGLDSVNWFHILGDEIHTVKNRKAQVTQALWRLPTIYKTGMSGTPADNKPTDLWAILHWLWPNYYTAFWGFVKAYMTVEMEEAPDGTGYRKIEGLNKEAVKHLHKEMAPWFTRRRKEDVLPDLPDKYYSRVWVELGPKQRKAYDQMKRTMIAWAEEWAEELEREDPIIANAAVSQLVRLQQYSAGYLVPLLDESDEQVIKPKHKCDKELRYLCVEDNPQDERCRWVPQFGMVDPSAKLDVLMELLEDRGDEPIVIFSHFKSVIKLLEKRLQKKGITYGLCTGDVSQADRAKNVRDFQEGKTRVFAGTIAAGGVGITLTRASTVVFIDRMWSPSKNGQAEDRCHRIGQAEAVEIIDLMAKNTVDLGKAQQLITKLKWLKMLLGDKVDTDLVIKNIDFTKALALELDEGEE